MEVRGANYYANYRSIYAWRLNIAVRKLEILYVALHHELFRFVGLIRGVIICIILEMMLIYRNSVERLKYYFVELARCTPRFCL